MHITKAGTVTISRDGIVVSEDFEFDDAEDSHIAGCRAAALLACAWAIQELSRELGKCVEVPGRGKIVV